MTRDFRAERARRDAAARAMATRQKNQRQTILRQATNVLRHDLADPVGYSPTWESTSPNRHATAISTTGVDPTKPPGAED